MAEIFLKKNSRIQALAMIMVLCLFIYSMVEFRLRRELKRSGETMISQTKKRTQRPTLKWVFLSFQKGKVIFCNCDGSKITKISHLSDDLKKILELMGSPYEKILFFEFRPAECGVELNSLS